MRRDYPEVGDLVVCTVEIVHDYGVTVSLDEYPGKKGFIHISEIASGWVKYIRDYVREGQKIVCQVIDVNKEKGHIDLSLKKVNEHQKREKIQEWKNEQKAMKLLEIFKERIKKKTNIEKIVNELEEEYETLYGAFEYAVNFEDKFRENHSGEWVEKFIEVAKENIEPVKVKVSGYVEIISYDRNAIDHIKEALLKAHDPNNGVYIHYVGAPRYRIDVEAKDYKEAEDKLRKAVEIIIETVKKKNGMAEFIGKEG
ncbi:MAG: translation initiation factor IF-2 subunit alpha [Thermoplasmata archaeon]|jgi:translation initiation factor 2 subunit 1